MAVTVICEKTGVEFEAATKRTKNHPAIMALVNEANKDGWYNQCIAALQESKGQFETVEEYVALLEEVKTATLNQQMIDYRAMMARKRAEREARIYRAQFNSWLSRHGYEWQRVGSWTEEEADAFDATAPIDGTYILVDSNNQIVENVAALKAQFDAI